MDIKDINVDEMKIDDVIEKINEIYKKSKEEGLTEEEKELQQRLRRRYIDSVKANFKAQMSGIEPKKKK
ncbi:DUF896 domain-containing protein [Clostridium sp. Ade.TY]|uniref:DUF896 domain-containing protein n=1 Tax=Clostridium sp. Ade.TY TaxID=1391647 RepID=UPI000401A842|nr:DUF896 domain-containing protein [Clostridium sp. Ade.TY]